MSPFSAHSFTVEHKEVYKNKTKQERVVISEYVSSLGSTVPTVEAMNAGDTKEARINYRTGLQEYLGAPTLVLTKQVTRSL